MSQIEDHRTETSLIERELMRKMLALGLDWHDDAAMKKLAGECKAFGPEQAQAAFAHGDGEAKIKAEIFALASLMMKTMGSAANDDREVHGGDVWKAFGKHLYE